MKGKLPGAQKSQQITSRIHLHKTPRSCNIIVTFLKANNKLKILKTQKTYLFMTHYQQESLLSLEKDTSFSVFCMWPCWQWRLVVGWFGCFACFIVDLCFCLRNVHFILILEACFPLYKLLDWQLFFQPFADTAHWPLSIVPPAEQSEIVITAVSLMVLQGGPSSRKAPEV